MRSRLLPVFALMLAAASAVSTVALAQATATGTAVPTMTPAPSCENPGNPPPVNTSELGRDITLAKQESWRKGMKAYMDCLKNFITEQQALAAPHIRATNTTIEVYNKAIKTYNEQVDAAKP